VQVQRQEQLSVDSQSFFYLSRVLKASALDPELDLAPPKTGATKEVFRLKKHVKKKFCMYFTNLKVFWQFNGKALAVWKFLVGALV
jgi:hypothetical protein